MGQVKGEGFPGALILASRGMSRWLMEVHLEELAAAFARQSGDLIPNFGGLIVSAVYDEACGIDATVSSITHWLETSEPLTPEWREAVIQFIVSARQRIVAAGSGGDRNQAEA